MRGFSVKKRYTILFPVLFPVLLLFGVVSSYCVADQVPLIPRAVLFGEPDKVHVRISPDGTKLAYFAPANGVLNIWVKTLGTEDDHPITHETKRGLAGFSWAYNNGTILYGKDDDGDENWHIWKVCLESGIEEDLTPFANVQASICALDKHFPDEALISMNKDNAKLFDIYRLNLLTGNLTSVTQNQGNISGWIPDSQFCLRAATVAEQDGSVTLLMRDDEKSEWVQRGRWNFEEAASFEVAGFSQDGATFYFVDAVGVNTKRLIKMNCKTGAQEIAIANDRCDIGHVLMDYAADKLLAVACNEERVQWKSLCPEFDQDLARILSANKGDLVAIDRSTDDIKWIVGFDDDMSPGAYYLYDRSAKKTEFICYVSSALRTYQLASMTPVVITARDGLALHGYLTCPAETPAKNQPLVLCVHGGPWARDAWGFNGLAQWLANRGYACLQINFRGSTGYGKQFINAANKQWSRKMQDDLTDAVNWAVNTEIADPKKVAIIGGSYGGYAALCGATVTPDLYCCAIDLCGPANLLTLLNSLPETWELERARFYKSIGDPVTEAEFLKSCSPLFNVDKIKIPIFVAQGAHDPRVKQAEAEQIVAALKARGLTYEYMLFPDEGHGLVRRENRLKFFAAAEKFLAKHLGGRIEE